MFFTKTATFFMHQSSSFSSNKPSLARTEVFPLTLNKSDFPTWFYSPPPGVVLLCLFLAGCETLTLTDDGSQYAER